MSRRLKITLPDGHAAQLDELAANTGEPVARLAGQMVRQGIAEVAPNGDVRPPRAELAPSCPTRPTRTSPSSGRRGLSPTVETRNGAHGCGVGSSRYTVAIRQRWPFPAGLKDGWWKSEAHVETLCALVVWRQWIDDAGRDPREELAFQVQLSDYGLALRQEGGGVTRAWTTRPGTRRVALLIPLPMRAPARASGARDGDPTGPQSRRARRVRGCGGRR